MRINNKKYEFKSTENIKIVHISDIHFSDNFNLKNLDLILENIKMQNPDYICITGDLIDKTNIKNESIEKYIDWLKKLATINKTIVVLGNHDIEYRIKKENKHKENEYFISSLKKIKNLYLLRNDIYKDENVTFVGCEIEYEHYIHKTIDTNKINNLIPDIKHNIMLIHDPSHILNNKDKINFENLDLILCGHTHGGLAFEFIPGHFGFISPHKKLFPKNMRGLFSISNTKLIISSGITKLSECSGLNKLSNIFSSNIITISLKK